MDSLLWPGGAKGTMAFDRDKFKRLVHYVIWKAGKRDWFGATKLNKVLWFSDTQAFALTGKHQRTDVVIFGPFDAMRQFTRPAAEIGTTGKVRAVPRGSPSTSPARYAGSFPITGNSLRPWAPCNAAGSVSGSDVVFSWIRRDRAPNVLHDGDGTVPMSEAAELYTFEAWAPVSGALVLVKKVIGLTTPTYTLLAADIAAAGVTGAVNYVVRITQDNAHGRGWPHVRSCYVR